MVISMEQLQEVLRFYLTQSDEDISSGDIAPICITGRHGIGKTQIISEICEELGMILVSFNCNQTKEGDMALPFVTKNAEGQPVVKFALHVLIKKIDAYSKQHPDKKIVLFIDELNRCQYSVQQEFMTLFRERRIVDYVLPDTVRMIAAQNPTSDMKTFMSKSEDEEYNTIPVDEAQKNRMTMLFVKEDIDSWFKWASQMKAGKEDEMNIHMDIQAFVASYPQFFYPKNQEEDVKCTPRSWQYTSAYYTQLKNKGNMNWNLFQVLSAGVLGDVISSSLVKHIKEAKNPLITPEEFFVKASDKELKELEEKYSNEEQRRKLLTNKNFTFWVEKAFSANSPKKYNYDKISERLIDHLNKYTPADIRHADIKQLCSSSAMYEIAKKNFVKVKELIDYFNKVKEQISS